MFHICSHSNKHEKKLMKLKKKLEKCKFCGGTSEQIGWKFLLCWDTKDQGKMSSDAVHLLCKGNASLHSNTNMIPTVRTSPRAWDYGFSCAHTASHILTHGVLDLVSPSLHISLHKITLHYITYYIRLHISLWLLRQKYCFSINISLDSEETYENR